MTRKIFTLGIIAVLMVSSNLFFAGCTEQSPPPKNQFKSPIILADDSNATSEGINKLVNGSNQFAFDFYSQITASGKNIFFSPYSISVALGMTFEGARGKTAEEMQSVLHFPNDDTVRRSAFAWLYNDMNKEEKEYILSTANALWASESYKFLDEYFDVIEKFYMGKVTNMDFINEAEESRQTINTWVEEQTNGKIKDLLKKEHVTAMTRLILTNAIYFKGNWVKQFNEKNTKESDFRVDSEKTVKVPMMSMRDETFNYTATQNLQILELPYQGEDLSMLIILPWEGKMDSVEESLTLENLASWRNNLREQKIDIYIPKFKFETRYDMGDTLKEMGMPTAFSPGGADFSGMDGSKRLFIDFVIHQGFVEVNEKGTEAAAATAVGMVETSIPNTFNADHPFIFLIQDRDSGNILFMGKVSDPSK
jgi:serpin B